jgi:type III restriction enzyme
MRFQFEPNLDYQLAAIEAVCDLFKGQETGRSEFTVSSDFGRDTGQTAAFTAVDRGIGNRLVLHNSELLQNLQAVQMRQGLRPSTLLPSYDFTVEMETGTGKTYVFLRTAFELHKRYGFSKFVIVVPSVAIKQGIKSSIDSMAGHFKALYGGVPFEHFIYDSKKLGQVRSFATSSTIQIMIVTVGAINKKEVNNLYKESEKVSGEKPIDLVRATAPILIVDEPQSVDGGLQGSGKEALAAMHPLCTLRYSATHAHKHQMVYRLDAVDAYQRRLVKEIEVAAAVVEGDHNAAYIKLLSVSNKKGFEAVLELDVDHKGQVRREKVKLKPGASLALQTGRSVYDGMTLQSIHAEAGYESVDIYPMEQSLLVGESTGGVDEDQVERKMIRRTITEHLEKEMRLKKDGIKVLSLFFLAKVEHYRQYAADGTPQKGKYALMFEEEYRAVAALPRYRTLFNDVDLDSSAEAVHNGYFSIDKKGRLLDAKEGNQGEDVERAFELIMKDKERLLSFDTKLKFIFSHSALKEGWDNPNVFQICNLRDMGSERERRQTIGRGLRICVNQDGDRVHGTHNRLTVIANESYQQFADNLQKEIEKETGITFGLLERHHFMHIAVAAADGQLQDMGVASSERLWSHLLHTGYVDAKGRVQETLRQALASDSLALPTEYEAQRPQIVEALKRVAGKLEIKNADERRTVPLNKARYLSPEFKELWDKIKHKTRYTLDFDPDKLISECTRAVQQMPAITTARIHFEKAKVDIKRSGVETQNTSNTATESLESAHMQLPDLLSELQNNTQLTRKSLVTILTDSLRLPDFLRNPQQFIALATEAIRICKRKAIVDGIRYTPMGEGAYYAQELFEAEELTGYLKNMLPVNKGVYEQVIFDSSVERDFARALEKREDVHVFAKLPGWFTIPTPLGSYNPDWAVLMEKEDGLRLYFVAETKSSLFREENRGDEKFTCGERHFEAIGFDGFRLAAQVADLG